MITIRDLSLSFGDQKIYDHISCTINQADRIGLVGCNGSGKSTLLKLIAQAVYEPNPCVAIAKNRKIAYFPQEVVLQSDKTIFEETFSSFDRVSALLKEATQLEKTLEESSHHAAALERYALIQQELIALNPHTCKSETQVLLLGLGFSLEDFNQPVAALSVGWKMRIVLAKLLLQRADFYLFDEPTNHLDIVAKEWFLQFLKEAPFGFILVCHERYFLDALCTKILDLELGKAKMFTGNYSTYKAQKEHDLVLLQAAYLQQQKEIKEKQETINRFRAQATKAKMVQSMIKALEKVERITLPPSLQVITIHFPPIDQSGRVVLAVHNVGFAFENKKIFSQVSFQLERGDKVALIAPNGVGKSTLFKLIAQQYPLQEGSITYGHNVRLAIFDQDQTTILPSEKTIFQTIEEACPKVQQSVIRSMLGAFLFSNDDVNKKIKVLSGGEKNRVGMVKVLLQQANFLLLDEPTNHLDMASKDVLLKALQEYKGTIFFVSHDQDFINRLATKVIELMPKGVAIFPGNYDLYLYQKQLNTGSKAPVNQPRVVHAQPVQKQTSSELCKKLKMLEKEIYSVESALKKLERSFDELTYGTPEYEKAQNAFKKYTKEHELLIAEWEALYHE